MSDFSFGNNVFKGHLLQRHQKASVCWKGLIASKSATDICKGRDDIPHVFPCTISLSALYKEDTFPHCDSCVALK